MIIPMKEWQYEMYNPLDRESAEAEYLKAEKQKILADSFEKTMASELVVKVISDIVENGYDLGKAVEIFKMHGGQINTSYGFVAEKNGKQTQYFMRKYNRFADENIIIFEHDFLKFLKGNGLDMIPEVIKAASGKTYIKSDELGKSYFYAVYEFLEGEDWYRWFEDTTPVDICYKIGVAVAKFHSLSSQYDCKYISNEPTLYEMMGKFKTILPDFSKLEFNSIYHQTYCNNLNEVMEAIDKILMELDEKTVEELPKVTINGDLHQGNLKYDSDGNVIGLFDFDWVKTDSRLNEIAGLLLYLVTSWQDRNDGEIYMDKMQAAMSGYQKTLKDIGKFAPMNEMEAKALPYYIQMCCIYNIVYWTAKDHYQIYDEINVYEYDYYLRHGLRVRRSAEKYADEITKIILEAQD